MTRQRIGALTALPEANVAASDDPLRGMHTRVSGSIGWPADPLVYGDLDTIIVDALAEAARLRSSISLVVEGRLSFDQHAAAKGKAALRWESSAL